jgi:hypothetical protein
MATTTIKYFGFAHLPAALQRVSAPIGKLADKLEALLPDGPEKSAGMRKLLEAKDCFVRSALEIGTNGMLPWQQRVLDERDELAEKLTALQKFCESPRLFEAVVEGEADRLARQAAAMSAYLAVLDERIAKF